uniref:Uncharacterized protein n=1 Tax=Trichogramma kaykai TaxID=54128 RepID=A0ABD2XA50_9HYME
MSPIDESFAYPLHWALKNGDWSTAGSLLTSGVDPNSADENGSTPLHVVCRRDDVDSAERMRLEYCEAIVDKLTNQDLCNICVAANV